METMSEFYNIDEIPYGAFPLYLKLVYHYKWEDPFLLEKLKCAEYQKAYVGGGRNTIELVMYKDKIVITHNLQK